MSDVRLKCGCGAVRGVLHDVTPATVNPIWCYCDDCQAFARAVGRPEVLDEHGGTLLVQASPAQLEITDGREHLAALRLTDRGMVRWYTTCCRTPIGNELASLRPPFVGILRGFLDAPSDDAIGPVRARVQTRFATGDPATRPPEDASPRVFVRLFGMLVRWWLRGDAKRSTFRDAQRRPIVPPRVLSAEELAAAKAS